MNLGDVAAKSVPKMTLVSAPDRRRRDRDAQLHPAPRPRLDRRARRRHRRHRLPAARQPRRRRWRSVPEDGRFLIEHPTGAAEVFLDLAPDGTLRGAGTVRTARKLFDGRVFPGPARAPALTG